MSKVKLIHHTPLSIAVQALRTCWDSFHVEGAGIYDYPKDILPDSDIEFLKRVVLKHKHGSGIEHIVYHFHISDISRALLQELARHRMASLTVKSTRYTLKELKNDLDLCPEKYLVMTGNSATDASSIVALANLKRTLESGATNDQAKYCLPEAYKTELRYSINARSLMNLLYLRTSKSALWEFQVLARNIYAQLPETHKFLFRELVDLAEKA